MAAVLFVELPSAASEAAAVTPRRFFVRVDPFSSTRLQVIAVLPLAWKRFVSTHLLIMKPSLLSRE
jgi:hypothetical protein